MVERYGGPQVTSAGQIDAADVGRGSAVAGATGFQSATGTPGRYARPDAWGIHVSTVI